MEKVWSDQAWEDYLWWQQADRKLLVRLNTMIRDCERDPFHGLGKPEPLKGDKRGYWSRRLTSEHRLVYKLENNRLMIAACRGHYSQ